MKPLGYLWAEEVSTFFMRVAEGYLLLNEEKFALSGLFVFSKRLFTYSFLLLLTLAKGNRDVSWALDTPVCLCVS